MVRSADDLSAVRCQIDSGGNAPGISRAGRRLCPAPLQKRIARDRYAAMFTAIITDLGAVRAISCPEEPIGEVGACLAMIALRQDLTEAAAPR